METGKHHRTKAERLSTRLRIWGSEVRILSGAPQTCLRRRTVFEIAPAAQIGYSEALAIRRAHVPDGFDDQNPRTRRRSFGVRVRRPRSAALRGAWTAL